MKKFQTFFKKLIFTTFLVAMLFIPKHDLLASDATISFCAFEIPDFDLPGGSN